MDRDRQGHDGRNGQEWTVEWTMDNGQWTMDNGQWTMDNEQWAVGTEIGIYVIFRIFYDSLCIFVNGLEKTFYGNNFKEGRPCLMFIKRRY